MDAKVTKGKGKHCAPVSYRVLVPQKGGSLLIISQERGSNQSFFLVRKFNLLGHIVALSLL